MRKLLTSIGLIISLSALLVAARSERNTNMQAGDTAHCNADGFVLTSPVDVRCAVFTATPTATNTPEPTATSAPTPLPTATSTDTSTPAPTATVTDTPLPTSTPTVTDTPLPTATATSTPLVTATPLARALWPLCPTHPNGWHAADDPARECHYDHEHGDDPLLAAGVFPDAARTISFAWATSLLENTAKHAGYKYFVNRNMPCDINQNYLGTPNVNCITDTLIEFHIVSSIMDGNARYHGYDAWYRVCKNPDFTECGTFHIAGWADYGVLNSAYAGPRVCRTGGSLYFGQLSAQGGGGYNGTFSYPADAPDLNLVAACGQVPPQPYVAMENINSIQPTVAQDVWNMSPLLACCNVLHHNPYAEFIVRVFDSWGYIDTVNPNAINFVCRDGSCPFNGSNRDQAGGSVRVLAEWDADDDGYADYNGYTDRYGNTVQGCTVTGLDCVPFKVVHAPVGYAHFDRAGCQCQNAIEYDIRPAGAPPWILFPNVAALGWLRMFQ